MESKTDGIEIIQRDQEFDESLDSDSKIEINGYEFFPSDVLYQMDSGAYLEALTDFNQNKRNGFLDLVEDEYPTPIALAYRKFKKISENSNQRLTLLRDCNESIVYLLYSLAIREFSKFTKGKVKLYLREKELKKNDFETEKIGFKVLLIKLIIKYFLDNGIESQIRNICSEKAIELMEKINLLRNSFSHTITLNEDESEKYLFEYEPLLEDLLIEINQIKDLVVFCYKCGAKKPFYIKADIIKGHSQEYVIDERKINESYYSNFENSNVDRCVFVETTNGEILNISPWFIFSRDNGKVKLKFFKRKKTNDNYYGLIGENKEEIINI